MTFYAMNEYRVDSSNASAFSIKDAETSMPKASLAVDDKKRNKALLKQTKKLSAEHKKLMADGRFSVLLVFQAMDAAGKDSTIKHVFRGLNPSGVKVHAFKQPSKTELKHDFLWRTNHCHPERGHIAIFNRSYYEEALVVRVNPEFLSYQNIPDSLAYESFDDKDKFWAMRFDAINSNETHLFNNGTLVLKFFLNVSRKEQQKRFLMRLNDSSKQWKFSAGDLKESARWDEYMNAYEQIIKHTASDKAPWYVIPADDKLFMRTYVADIVHSTLKNLPLEYPTLDADMVEINAWKKEINQVLDSL